MSESTSATEGSPQHSIGSHSRTAKIIHWGFIGVFVYMLTKQVDEVEELENVALLREEVILAIVFLLLLIGRFIYMRSTQPTVLPRETPKYMLLLAKAVHLGMYASLALIAITGLMIGGLYGSGTKSGALLEAVLLSHEIFFWASVNLILLHVAGALYHRYLGDGVWSSMVPVWKEGSK